nr:probable tyrosine-protein phosphatase At1g05000 [Ipomoea batatas]
MGLILDGEEDENRSIAHDGVLMAPPPNFSAVEAYCIYRSGFPQSSNFPFLHSLNLRSVIYLCQEPYPDENKEFLRLNNIKLFQFGIDGTKEPSTIPMTTITEAVKILIAPNRVFSWVPEETAELVFVICVGRVQAFRGHEVERNGPKVSGDVRCVVFLVTSVVRTRLRDMDQQFMNATQQPPSPEATADSEILIDDNPPAGKSMKVDQL